MCGITGLYNFESSNAIELNQLKEMVNILHHRGPDEKGIYVDNHIGLGHARLSIIDLAGGSQPIHNEDESMWIIFNGEIFNYIELRQLLVDKGHTFYTTSDTEVILHLFEEFDTDCLNMMNGQFAFAIWNNNTKNLFLARDRVGIRPLHYTTHKGTLYFSSEIKSILTHRQIPRELDPVVLDQIFTFWTPLPGQTIFKNIYELPPGHYMKVSKGNIHIQKYWELPFYGPDDFIDDTPEIISQEIYNKLYQATKIRLRADVPVGTYLSGGLDSSGITSLVINNFNSDVRTFGIRFEDENFDEGSYQQQMVKYLHANHTEITAMNTNIAPIFDAAIWHIEKPILRTAPVPLYMLSRCVYDNNLKVVLTGEGADEFFGGYNIFRETKVRQYWARYPQSTSRPALIAKLYPYIFKDPRLKKSLQAFFAKGLDQPNALLFSHMIRWENTRKIRNFYSEQMQEATAQYNPYDQLLARLPENFDRMDPITRAQHLETSLFLSNYLLSSQGDRVAMANSVEIRLPYLDVNLIEYIGRIHPKYKIRGLKEKYLLKKALSHLLPENITHRPKQPYRAPIQRSFLNEQDTEMTERLLSEEALNDSGLFNTAKTQLLLKKLKSNRASSETDNMALVGLLSTQMIHQKFIKPTTQPTLVKKDNYLLVDNR